MYTKYLLGAAAAIAVAAAQNSSNSSEPLLHYGMVVFPAFEPLDVFGPLDALNILSYNHTSMNLHIVAPTMDPVSSSPQSAGVGKFGGSFNQEIVPTHTYENAPDLDVLMVPGGPGVRATDEQLKPTLDFIKARFPTVKYIFTTCTGSGLVAKTGVLDGHRATGNKKAWQWVTSQGPNVNWVSHARWVADDNVWTTSGVAAGLDGVFAFIADKYSLQEADDIAMLMEYERHTDPDYDPFADHYNLK